MFKTIPAACWRWIPLAPGEPWGTFIPNSCVQWLHVGSLITSRVFTLWKLASPTNLRSCSPSSSWLLNIYQNTTNWNAFIQIFKSIFYNYNINLLPCFHMFQSSVFISWSLKYHCHVLHTSMTPHYYKIKFIKFPFLLIYLQPFLIPFENFNFNVQLCQLSHSSSLSACL